MSLYDPIGAHQTGMASQFTGIQQPASWAAYGPNIQAQMTGMQEQQGYYTGTPLYEANRMSTTSQPALGYGIQYTNFVQPSQQTAAATGNLTSSLLTGNNTFTSINQPQSQLQSAQQQFQASQQTTLRQQTTGASSPVTSQVGPTLNHPYRVSDCSLTNCISTRCQAQFRILLQGLLIHDMLN